MRLVIHPDAAADIAEQAAYYAGKEAGLGRAFLDEINAGVEMIMAMPAAFRERRRNLRMFVLPRFRSLCYIASRTRRCRYSSYAIMHVTKITGWAGNE